MSTFELPYTSESQPAGLDGQPQQRVIRGCLVLPTHGTAPFPVVIIAHGYTSFMDWGFYPEISRMLAAAGFASLRFNFSGSGIGADRTTMTEPEVFQRNSYLHELDDLALLRRRLDAGAWPELDPTRCSILGHSRGGAMSIVHAAETGGYQTVITWAGMDRILQFTAERLAQWERDGFVEVMHWTARQRLRLDVETLHAARANADRLDVLAACGRLRVPLLVVMGDADRGLPFEVGENLAAAAHDGRLIRIAGGDHTFGARHPLATEAPATLTQALDATRNHLEGLR